jgi:hypothetical protein
MKRLILICCAILLGKMLFAEEGWGVIAVMEANALDKTGNVATTLMGSERFSIKKSVKVEGEPAYYVTMFDRKKQPSYVVWARDCYVSMTAMPDKETDLDGYIAESLKRKKIVNYYSKYFSRERLRQRAVDAHRKKSPAALLKKEEQKLAQIKKAIATLNDRIEKNAAARKKATGSTHIRLVEEGRELRAEQGALPATYKEQKEKVAQLKEKLEAWDAAHPFDDSKVTNTTVWKKQTLELVDLANELKAAGVELVNDVTAE